MCGMNRKLLAAVYAKTDGHCWYCGVHVPPFSNWEIDHQDPVSQGGSDGLANLVPACRPCNSRKSGRDIGEYQQFLVDRGMALINEAYDFTRLLDGPDTSAIREHLSAARDLLVNTIIVFWGDRSTDEVDDLALTEEEFEMLRARHANEETPVQ
jgi:hypothetical protein